MAVILQHKEFTVEVFDAPAFDTTTDMLAAYKNIYQPLKDKDYKPISQHAIIVYHNNRKVASAILLAAAGGTSVTPDSVFIDDDNLITRCCNTVFSLTPPDLNLNWMTEADWATCFSIHKYQDSYITHGETAIARINRNGEVLWSYSGADIFVCLEKGNPFEMLDNSIKLTDFNGASYEINYNGETINYNKG